MKVCELYLSPAHNFFGHHGLSPGAHDAVSVPAIECVAGRGIRGDRFFDFKKDYKGQITFFSAEVFEELCAALKVAEMSAGATRRNVIVRGVDLNALVGAAFEIQGVRFMGAAECAPCYWMDQVFGPGAEAFLKGRGGLRARILTDGILEKSP